MRTIPRIFRCIAVSALSIVAAAQCTQQTGTGVTADDFNSLFTQNGPGWTGGDSTYSMRLPDGRKLFFFSDSYIASSPVPNGATVVPETRTRTSPFFQAHNSLVVQNVDGSLTTIAGGDSQNPTSLFVPANSSDRREAGRMCEWPGVPHPFDFAQGRLLRNPGMKARPTLLVWVKHSAPLPCNSVLDWVVIKADDARDLPHAVLVLP